MLRFGFSIGALALALAAAAGCGGGDASTSGSGAGRAEPEGGTIALTATVDDGTRGEEANTKITDSYWRERPGAPPRSQLAFESAGGLRGTSIQFAGDLTILPGRAVLEYRGQNYELSPQLIESTHRSQRSCQRALAAVRLGRLESPAGSLDEAGAERLLSSLTGDPGCSRQVKTIPFLAGVLNFASNAPSRYRIQSRVEASTGHGDLPTRLYLSLTLLPRQPGVDEYEVLFEYVQVPSAGADPIAVPAAGKPLDSLAGKFGSGGIARLKEGIGGFAALMQAAAE